MYFHKLKEYFYSLNFYKRTLLIGTLFLLQGMLSTAIGQFILWFGFKNGKLISFSNVIYFFTQNGQQRMPIWMLNCFFYIAIQLGLLIILNRLFSSQLIYASLVVILNFAQYQKITIRTEPIVPGDITSINEIFDSLKFVNTLDATIIIGFLISLIVFIMLIYKDDIKIFNWHKRLIFSIVPIFAFILFFNRPNQLINQVFNALGDNVRFQFDSTIDVSQNGVIVSLANKLAGDPFDGSNIEKEYNKKNIKKIVEKYSKQANEINKTRKNDNFKGQTVITLLSESFEDPNYTKGFQNDLSSDPLPYIHSLQQDNSVTSGLQIVPGFGGKTADSEYQVLTGMNMANFAPTIETPYIQVLPHQKQVVSFANQFDTKLAMHPFITTYYNRPGAYKQMGFSKLYSQDDMKLKKLGTSQYNSDASFFNNVYLKISNSKNKSQYINLISMQNHTAFTPNKYGENNFKVTKTIGIDGKTKIDDENKGEAETYLQGINYTDTAIKDFLNNLNKEKRPITLLFYGDHHSSLSGYDNIDDDMGHATPYFIWQNDAAKNKNGNNKVQTNKIITQSSLTNMIMTQNNMKISPFFALLQDLQNEPAIASYDQNPNNIKLVNDNFSVTSKLTDKQKELIRDYQLIQYDIEAGKQYSISDKMYKVNK